MLRLSELREDSLERELFVILTLRLSDDSEDRLDFVILTETELEEIESDDFETEKLTSEI